MDSKEEKHVTYVSGLVKTITFGFLLTQKEVVNSVFVLLKNVIKMRWFGFFSVDEDFPVLRKPSVFPFPGK